ncbi:MAG TPA: signal recognition particle-docking protein FtsY [Ilumatobacteraceae bacterium]|nr:signal recognition particle-docking protein FtsY [Ilumatobacteraceae bacterium]
MEWIFLVLIGLVLLFGIGVLVVSRLRATRSESLPPAPPRTPPTAPPQAPRGTGTAVLEPEVLEPEVLEPEVLEPEVIAPVTLRERMARARNALAGAFTGVRGRRGITDETWDELEEGLLLADVGIGVTTTLLDDLRSRVKDKEITEPEQLLDALRDDMKGQLDGADRELHFEPATDGSPNVWLFVGVNGVGKTTTIGKVADQQRADGRSVLLAAGDTFRAAAAEQLGTWAERAGAELVRGNEGGDPGAVVFDAVEAASARGVDLVLADTAGRLHTKTNLMEELRKVRRVAEKGAGRVTEVLLVIDATTGQNGLAQAREFGDASQVTGVVLTKLDGSAKGGIVFAVETELGLPVKLVGVGETIGDLVPFDPDEFVDALF